MIMPNKIDTEMLAPCGVNCVMCVAHLKKKNPCAGCYAPDEQKRKSCINCIRKNCADKKGHKWCFECDDFPCKDIKTLDKSYRTRYGISLIENGRYAKENGIDKLITEQHRRLTCSDCGGVICQHDDICSECGIKTEVTP